MVVDFLEKGMLIMPRIGCFLKMGLGAVSSGLMKCLSESFL
ncbi:hypothetical protein HMPREF9370_1478 [Neisseria wadsworthii 9715]|uniref:Uncharacterized protein n=1 Tax=Neisseria wadsworthii 9715 TaxID=1030841 RepID=G4CQW8_9NEIS|nr:hypothetical protein HMPREF9370_1478 [Neisseria wadsworthii 9715]